MSEQEQAKQGGGSSPVGSGACLRSVVMMSKRLWLVQKRNNWALDFSDNDKRLLTVVGISASEGVQKDRDSDA